MKNINQIALVAGILLLLNLLSRQFFVRLDLTQNQQYTLSKATKNSLKEIDEPILVKAFFTKELPEQYQKTQRDFQNLLIEYTNRSGGMIDFEFIDAIDENEQLALQNGIQPLLINLREKNELIQKKAFMGAVLEAGDRKDIIPFIQPEGPMEYQLTTAVKKVSNAEKPAIGIIQGHGEASLQDMSQALQTMSILYNVEELNLNTATEISARFKTVVLVKPRDTIPTSHLMLLDQYLALGGNLLIACDRVQGDFQSVQGSELSIGLDPWLARRGIEIAPQFLVDASAGSITVQQQQGFFRYNSQVEFPFFPLVTQFADHPITKGIEQVVFQFVSPIYYKGDSTSQFVPIVTSSGKSGLQAPPIGFDIQRQWTAVDFPMRNLTIGAVLKQSNEGSIVIFSDGDFALGAQSRGQNPDNISLLVNAVDYISDDTGLIDLRTKGVESRPIKDLEQSEIVLIKWISFLLPILLVFIYAFVRFQRNRSKRLRRMAERYV